MNGDRGAPPRTTWNGASDETSGHGRDGAWIDQDAQEVRPYVVAGDRTRPRHAMRLDTVVTAATARTADAAHLQALPPEAAHALRRCWNAECSIAEIAAVIGQPILVTKILVSDLIDCGALTIAVPATPLDPETGQPSHQVLEALRIGLETYDAAVA